MVMYAAIPHRISCRGRELLYTLASDGSLISKRVRIQTDEIHYEAGKSRRPDSA